MIEHMLPARWRSDAPAPRHSSPVTLNFAKALVAAREMSEGLQKDFRD
jgi:hypothetical protein